MKQMEVTSTFEAYLLLALSHAYGDVSRRQSSRSGASKQALLVVTEGLLHVSENSQTLEHTPTLFVTIL